LEYRNRTRATGGRLSGNRPDLSERPPKRSSVLTLPRPALLAGPVEGRGEPARRVVWPRTRELDVVDHVAGAFARQHDHVLPRCLGAVAELHGGTRDAAA